MSHEERALYFRRLGYRVLPDERYGIATISGPGDPITLAGETGTEFFVESRRVWEETGELAWSDAMASVALKYVVN